MMEMLRRQGNGTTSLMMMTLMWLKSRNCYLKFFKITKKHGKKCKQKEESSCESDSSDAESQSEYCPSGSSYYEDDEPVEKPKKVKKKAKHKIKIKGSESS